MLERKGVPGVVQKTLIRPPSSKLGPVDDATRRAVMASSPMAGKYDTGIDRESAFEVLQARAANAAKEAHVAEAKEGDEASPALREFQAGRRYSGARVSRSTGQTSSSSRRDSVGTTFAKSFARQLGSNTGRAVVRGIMGGLFRGR
jgi:DNA helicase HerA-like ATPase